MRRINLIKLSSDLYSEDYRDLYSDDYPYHDISSEPIFGSMSSLGHLFSDKKKVQKELAV